MGTFVSRWHYRKGLKRDCCENWWCDVFRTPFTCMIAGVGNPSVCSGNSVETCISARITQPSVYSPVSVQCSTPSSIKYDLCNGCLNLFVNMGFTLVIIACRLSTMLLGFAFPEETLAIPVFLTELLIWKCFQFC